MRKIRVGLCFILALLVFSLSFVASGSINNTAPTPYASTSEPAKETKSEEKEAGNKKNIKLTKPYVKLFTFVSPGTINNITQDQIEYIANTYSWINGHGGSWIKPVDVHTLEGAWEYFAGRTSGGGLVDELRKINKNIILTNYRNGAYTNQNAIYEAASVEENIPLAIAVYDAGLKLAADVSATAETILAKPIEKVPVGKPQYYPLKASTTDGEFSIGKVKYLSWFRLNDEMIRINEVKMNDDGLIELKVVRGYSETEAQDHTASSLVLHPVYCGKFQLWNQKEAMLSGYPDGTGPQVGLRYIMNSAKEEYWDWLGDIVEEIFEEGYNGPWLDCTVSTSINHCDAYGTQNIVPYDVGKGKKLDRETYREYHQQKIDYLFERFPDGEFYVNWNFPQNYFDNGHERYMFSGENGHTPISGGSIEHYTIPTLREDNAGKLQHWLEERTMQIDMVKNNFRAVSWAKDTTGEAWNQFSPEYALFSYGTFLLTYEKNAEQYWGARGNPVPAIGLTPEEGPPDFVYYDLGQPTQHFSKISEAELKKYPGVYSRKFSKGIILVNPDPDNTKNVELEKSYYEIESQTMVNSVELPPRSARILLKKDL